MNWIDKINDPVIQQHMEEGIPVLDKGFVRLVEWSGDDTSIVTSARVSYGQGSKGEEKDRRLLHYLLRNRHFSPFEQVSAKFHVKLPIFIARQWMRHRSQVFNEISGRYVELGNEYYKPSVWRKQAKVNKQASEFFEEDEDESHQTKMDVYFDLAMKQAAESYDRLLAAGAAREMARMVLTLNHYTEFYVTASVRSWIHFLDLRDDSHAQWEIQQYASAVRQVLRPLFPWTIEYIEED